MILRGRFTRDKSRATVFLKDKKSPLNGIQVASFDCGRIGLTFKGFGSSESMRILIPWQSIEFVAIWDLSDRSAGQEAILLRRIMQQPKEEKS